MRSHPHALRPVRTAHQAGVIVVDKNGNGKFTILEIIIWNEDKGTAYISQEEFPQGTVLIQPDSEERLTLTETTGIKGVYNVNKGYAVFKRVTILCESDEYYIVKESEKGGLSNYDPYHSERDKCSF